MNKKFLWFVAFLIVMGISCWAQLKLSRDQLQLERKKNSFTFYGYDENGLPVCVKKTDLADVTTDYDYDATASESNSESENTQANTPNAPSTNSELYNFVMSQNNGKNLTDLILEDFTYMCRNRELYNKKLGSVLVRTREELGIAPDFGKSKYDINARSLTQMMGSYRIRAASQSFTSEQFTNVLYPTQFTNYLHPTPNPVYLKSKLTVYGKQYDRSTVNGTAQQIEDYLAGKIKADKIHYNSYLKSMIRGINPKATKVTELSKDRQQHLKNHLLDNYRKMNVVVYMWSHTATATEISQYVPLLGKYGLKCKPNDITSLEFRTDPYNPYKFIIETTSDKKKYNLSISVDINDVMSSLSVVDQNLMWMYHMMLPNFINLRNNRFVSWMYVYKQAAIITQLCGEMLDLFICSLNQQVRDSNENLK